MVLFPDATRFVPFFNRHVFSSCCNAALRRHDQCQQNTAAGIPRFEVRYVSANGGIRWEHDWVNVSTVCAGDYVGLEEIDDGVWNVYFGPLKLGRFLECHRRIEDAYGRLLRSQ